MPIYDYACLACGKNFEIVRRISRSSAAKCPKCGSGKTERRIVPPNFILKGAGFYVNDSKSGAAAPAKPDKAAKTEKSDKAATPAKSDKPAAPAPAEKKESKPGK